MPNWLFIGQAKVAVDISALGIAPPPNPLTGYGGAQGGEANGRGHENPADLLISPHFFLDRGPLKTLCS